jgi:hypothetical protein
MNVNITFIKNTCVNDAKAYRENKILKYIIGNANDEPTNFRSIVNQIFLDYCIYVNNIYFSPIELDIQHVSMNVMFITHTNCYLTIKFDKNFPKEVLMIK